jgi:WD40 repeat protein
LYDWNEKKTIERWVGHEGDVNSIVQGNDFVFSGSRDKTVRIWKRSVKDAVSVLTGHEMNITSVECFLTNEGSISRSLLVSGSRDATIRVWDIETGTCINTKRVYRNLVTGICALRDEHQAFLQISEDLTIRTWDVRNMDVVNSITGLINIPVSYFD